MQDDDAKARRTRLLLLGGIIALGSAAIHMFVPAMPEAAIALGAASNEVQLALTVYLIGVAAGQVATGPLADRFGRRATLLGGAALFVLGSAMCSGAGSIRWLLLGRAVQALGASSGLVAGRAMAGDRGGSTGTRDMALLTATVMLSPMLAPVLGSALAAVAGWRAVFVALLLGGALCFVAIWRRLHDPYVRQGESTLVADWRAVLQSGAFRRNLALGNAFSGGMYAFLAASPFLLVQTYHATTSQLGFLYGSVAVGAALGALTANRLAKRGRSDLRTGTRIVAVAGVLLLAGALAAWHDAIALVGPMALFAFGGGLVTPVATMGALADTPTRIGTAVSLYGALQMASNALVTLLVVAFAGADPRPPALLIASLALVALLLGERAQRA